MKQICWAKVTIRKKHIKYKACIVFHWWNCKHVCIRKFTWQSEKIHLCFVIIILRKGKALKKHSLHGENSSLVFIEAKNTDRQSGINIVYVLLCNTVMCETGRVVYPEFGLVLVELVKRIIKLLVVAEHRPDIVYFAVRQSWGCKN